MEHYYQINFEFGAKVQEMKFKDHFVQQRDIVYGIGRAKYGRYMYKIIFKIWASSAGENLKSGFYLIHLSKIVCANLVKDIMGNYCVKLRALDFQQYVLCDHRSLRSACAYAKSEQSHC